MQTKELIFENAKKLFAQDGYQATSMSIIAKACNKNKATLYHYYKSKEVLYNDILALFLHDLQANIGRKTLPLPEAQDQIKAYITVLIEQDRDILTIINRQILDGNEHLSDSNLDSFHNIQKSFDAIFKLGIVNGEFEMMSPKTIYHIVFGACSHYVLGDKTQQKNSEIDDKRFIDELFSIIIRSIKS